MKKWYMAESGIFGISSSVRSIWHGSGILYRQLLISLQWDLEIFWDLDIFTSLNFELTVQDAKLFLLVCWFQKYHFQVCTIFSCKIFEF